MPSNQILVIEDHPLFATGIKDLVEFVATNADILCAASIAHAKELFSKNSPALVITDLRLPDCQGSRCDRHAGPDGVANLPTLIMSGDDTLLHSIVPNQHAPSWTLSKSEGFEQTSADIAGSAHPRRCSGFSGAPTPCQTAKPTASTSPGDWVKTTAFS
jgi:DNA-binding NarL/FixJ family response regulator